MRRLLECRYIFLNEVIKKYGGPKHMRKYRDSYDDFIIDDEDMDDLSIVDESYFDDEFDNSDIDELERRIKKNKKKNDDDDDEDYNYDDEEDEEELDSDRFRRRLMSEEDFDRDVDDYYESETPLTQKHLLKSFIAKDDKLHGFLTKEQEIELGKMVAHGTPEEREKAIQTFVERNIRLVVNIASKYSFPKVETDDLIQEGMFGLMKAAEKWDYAKGWRFSTYATWWIKQAILRSAHDISRSIRIPLNVIYANNKFKEAFGEFEETHGRTPSDDEIREIGQDLHLPNSAIQAVIDGVISDVDSLERFVSDENGDREASLLDMAIFKNDFSPDVTNEYAKTEYENLVIYEFLSILPPRERTIVMLYTGVGQDDNEKATLQEIAGIMGITRERVRQLYHGAIKKMQDVSDQVVKRHGVWQ